MSGEQKDKQESENRWHLNKSVPVSTIMVIMAQTIILIVWGVKLDARVGVLEVAQYAFSQRVSNIEESMKQIAIIAERQRVGYGLLEENSRKIDRLADEISKLSRQK